MCQIFRHNRGSTLSNSPPFCQVTITLQEDSCHNKLSLSLHTHIKVWPEFYNQWCKYLLWSVWTLVTLFLMQHSSPLLFWGSRYGSTVQPSQALMAVSVERSRHMLLECYPWWMHDCCKRGLIAEIADKCRRALVWYLSTVLCLQVGVRMWAEWRTLFSEEIMTVMHRYLQESY